MCRFSQQAREVVGGEEFATFEAQKLCVELYLGRFGRRIRHAEKFAEQLNRSQARWLITCDRGLIEAGAAAADEAGEYSFDKRQGKGKTSSRFRTLPGEVGRVRLRTEPIFSQGWGRMYLIEVRRPVRLSGRPIDVPHISGKRDDL